MIRELGHEGVQFATFSETVVPYYPYFSFVIGGAREMPALAVATDLDAKLST